MAQFFGLYQLENLHRAQTKFILVAIVPQTSTIADDAAEVPSHPLLKPDFVLGASEAPAKIQARMSEMNYPAWWPVVLISKSGEDEAEVVQALEASGLINVYRYRGGWNSLLAGT